MIKIRAFRAIDDPESCKKYIEGHSRILQIHGVTRVTSANVSWAENPGTYVIIAESDSEGKVYGGARIQVANDFMPLPIVGAISDMDIKIHSLIEIYTLTNTGELCGLWNSREVAGMGIGSVFMTRAGVAITSQLKLNSLFALCASYTVSIANKVGFVIEDSLGDHGTFYYPKEDLLATAVILKDPSTLTSADSLERDYIFDLRNNPKQVKLEMTNRGEVELEFDLLLPETSINT